MKKYISIMLVLMLCFSVMTVIAAADKVDATVDKIETIVDTIETASNEVQIGSFNLSDVFSNLFAKLKLDSVWDFIRSILNAVRGIDFAL